MGRNKFGCHPKYPHLFLRDAILDSGHLTQERKKKKKKKKQETRKKNKKKIERKREIGRSREFRYIKKSKLSPNPFIQLPRPILLPPQYRFPLG